SYLAWNSQASELTSGYLMFTKLADLASPGAARIFLFQDVLPENICYPAFVVRMPGGSPEGFFHYPSSQHNGGGVLAYCDGHTEYHRWRDRRTRPGAISGIVAHTTSSPNNPDLE